MIAFLYKNIVIGGVHTLLYRMSNCLLQRGFSVGIYCNSISPDIIDFYHNSNIPLIIYPKNLKYIFRELNSNDNYIIVFEFDLYLDLVLNTRKRGNNKIFLYSVHPYTFDYYFLGVDLKKKFHHRVFEKEYSKFIAEEVKNGFIFFMDEQTLLHSIQEYHISISPSEYESHIVRIIMNKHNSIKKEEDLYKHKFEILTISRADFPFKGYLKELIQIVYEFQKKENVGLTVISSGPHIKQLMNWIETYDVKQEFISLVTNVPYNKLNDYYNKADIYVGMGTTILEAANCGVISLPVEPYTYECKSYGFFNSNPKWVLTDYNKGSDVRIFLSEVMNMPLSEKNNIQIS